MWAFILLFWPFIGVLLVNKIFYHLIPLHPSVSTNKLVSLNWWQLECKLVFKRLISTKLSSTRWKIPFVKDVVILVWTSAEHSLIIIQKVILFINYARLELNSGNFCIFHRARSPKPACAWSTWRSWMSVPYITVMVTSRSILVCSPSVLMILGWTAH